MIFIVAATELFVGQISKHFKYKVKIMFQGFSNLVQALIELVKHRAMRESRIFRDVIRPMCDELVVIHKDYIGLFEKTKAILEDGEVEDPDVTRLREAENWLKTNRREMEAARTLLASASHALSRSDKLPKRFLRFVELLYDYFDFLDEGCRRHRGSSSIRLLDEIVNYRESLESGKESPIGYNHVVMRCENAIDGVRMNLAEVFEEYANLQIDVLS